LYITLGKKGKKQPAGGQPERLEKIGTEEKESETKQEPPLQKLPPKPASPPHLGAVGGDAGPSLQAEHELPRQQTEFARSGFGRGKAGMMITLSFPSFCVYKKLFRHEVYNYHYSISDYCSNILSCVNTLHEYKLFSI
jgi:hypothetical protein